MGRDRNGEIKLSLRAKDIEILNYAEQALKNLDGFVGGHAKACGGKVKKEHYSAFIKNLSKLLRQNPS